MLRSVCNFSLLPLLSLMAALTQGAQVEVDWFIPPNSDSLPPKTAKVGDRAVFVWEQFHDVHLHPSKTCDEAGALAVGFSSGATYTFTEVGEFVFSCNVGDHCENGQIVTFTVSAADITEAPVAISTEAPVATSTEAPVMAPSPQAPTETPPTSAPVGSGSTIAATSLAANVVLMLIVASGLIQ